MQTLQTLREAPRLGPPRRLWMSLCQNADAPGRPRLPSLQHLQRAAIEVHVAKRLSKLNAPLSGCRCRGLGRLGTAFIGAAPPDFTRRAAVYSVPFQCLSAALLLPLSLRPSLSRDDVLPERLRPWRATACM